MINYLVDKRKKKNLSNLWSFLILYDSFFKLFGHHELRCWYILYS